MEIVLLLARILLSGIFLLAGITKLFDPKGADKALQDFGVPKSLAMPGAVALSLGEITIAVLLLSIETSWFGAVAASSLLVLFIGQMAYQLARGNAPDCHCFGQIYSEPVSTASILRNVLFLVPAAYLAYGGRRGQGMALSDPRLDQMQLVFGIAIVSLLVAAIFYLRVVSAKQDTILKQIEVMELVARDGASVEREDVSHPHEGLPIGAVVGDLELPDLDGETVSIAGLKAAELPVLFVYVSPTCSPCKALVPEFEQWRADLTGKVDVVLVSNGKSDDNREKFLEFGGMVLLQEDREFAEMIKAQWTPTAVLMGRDGRIASHLAAGDAAIRHLVEHISTEDLAARHVHFTNGHGLSQTNKIGREVPEFSLADISGRTVTNADLKGKQTLVAFWSLTCGYCDQMIEELRNWDKVKGKDAPDLLVFSDGEPEGNLKLGLASPVVIDPDQTTSSAMGMFGTPSAVLVDENGVIVTETALGAADIWALVGKKK